MRNEKEVREQLAKVYAEIERIEREEPVGTGLWSSQKAYSYALQWVLEED